MKFTEKVARSPCSSGSWLAPVSSGLPVRVLKEAVPQAVVRSHLILLIQHLSTCGSWNLVTWLWSAAHREPIPTCSLPLKLRMGLQNPSNDPQGEAKSGVAFRLQKYLNHVRRAFVRGTFTLTLEYLFLGRAKNSYLLLTLVWSFKFCMLVSATVAFPQIFTFHFVLIGLISSTWLEIPFVFEYANAAASLGEVCKWRQNACRRTSNTQ